MWQHVHSPSVFCESWTLRSASCTWLQPFLDEGHQSPSKLDTLVALSLPTRTPGVIGTYFGEIILFFAHKFEGTVLNIMINIVSHRALYVNIYTYMNANYVIIGNECPLCLVNAYGGALSINMVQ